MKDVGEEPSCFPGMTLSCCTGTLNLLSWLYVKGMEKSNW